MAIRPVEDDALLDVSGAAVHLGVTEAFVRRLVLERRVRYFKVGKFVRFRTVDLDAFVEAGRKDPVAVRVHMRSPQRSSTTQPRAQRPAADNHRRDSASQRSNTSRD